MSRQELAEVLDDMRQRVLAGDSYEGSLEYRMPENDLPPEERGRFPSPDADFWVTGLYRVGNLQGQGGMRVIGALT
jgi:hypothetical protein